ncbi:MAG: hypothetical protein WED05_10645 [Candidatus Atabeyarchaeum deiterrae]
MEKTILHVNMMQEQKELEAGGRFSGVFGATRFGWIIAQPPKK